jgi:hypothetical protein
MSIPLDRLYHHIDNVSTDICDGDLVIYRFYPHGSKKIEDILPLKTQSQSWIDNMILPNMICHDQEPLDFEAYNISGLALNHVTQRLGAWVDKSDSIAKMFSGMHLRSILRYPLHCYDLVLLCHSEKNSKQLEYYEQNGFLGVYWWSHAVIARDWFRYAKQVAQKKQVQKTFLIYNRAWSGTREYRLRFAELLIHLNLQEHCKTSVNPVEPELGLHYDLHIFKNTQWRPQTVLENFFPPSLASSNYSADFDLKDYESTDIEVVLETLFDDSRLHLTEKTLRPIACAQPFILAGTHGSLEYLRNYGFKTFGDIWDESYDLVEDPAERLLQIAELMKYISNWTPEQRDNKMSQARIITEYNKELFFSDRWHNSIVNEYRQNLQQAMSIMNQNKTAKYLQQITKEKQQNPEFKTTMDSIVTSVRTPEELARLYKHIGVDL